ncbi:hypothetical protein HQ585_04780 [candidate division KSB1 bacterium]|nr:hypothetical protein [candidate division KSB1 bacterium]
MISKSFILFKIHTIFDKTIRIQYILFCILTLGFIDTGFAQDDSYSFGLEIPPYIQQHWQMKTSDIDINHQNYPPAIDWSYRDSPVKNQGGCGSCWAFAAVALIENISWTSDLSEQMVIACASGDCGSGWYGNALQLASNDGIVPEDCYPYQATNGNCADKCSDPFYVVTVGSYDYTGIWGEPNSITREWLKEVLTMGPVCVAMDVPDDGTFTGYTGGIYNYQGGPIPDNRGHAVLVVGYNENEQYFRAKNSWGPGWGENGYFRISYNDVTDDVHFGGFACRAYDATIDTLNPPPAEQLQLISPNGGEYWIYGQTRSILWESEFLSGFVNLEYTDNDGAQWVPIASNIPDTEAYDWLLSSRRSFRYRIRISDADGSISDFSDGQFGIDREYIRVNIPNGGEQWPVQSEQTIVWESSLTSGMVSISYTTDSNITWIPIAEQTLDNGIFQWQLPNESFESCRIHIADYDGSFFDRSNQPFSIIPDSTQSIHVETPNGGEEWIAGSTRSISWISQQTSEWIELSYRVHPDSIWVTIDTTASQTSPYHWDIPSISSTQVQVRVTDADGFPEDMSDSSFAVFILPSGTVVASISTDWVQEGKRAAFPVYLDMGAMDPPNENLGAYSASIKWNPHLLQYGEAQGGSTSGWELPEIITTDADSGRITFSQEDLKGSTDLIHIFTLLLDVTGFGGQSDSLILNFNVLTSAKTGLDLLSNLEIEDYGFTIIPTGILGDVDDDGFVTSTDALIIFSCDTGLDVSDYCPLVCGDVNSDGVVNSTDGLIILSYNVGMEVPYPIGEPGCPSNVADCSGCTL